MLPLRTAALISVAGLVGGSIAPTPAHGGDLVGPSFRMRGAHTSALAARALVASGPRFSSSGAALGQGDYFGEMAILDHESRSATLTAESDCELLKLHQEDFYELLHEHPELSGSIIRTLAKRLRRLLEER